MFSYDVNDIDIRYDELRTHDEISRRAMFSDEHLIKARMSSENSLFVNPFDTDVMLSGDSPHFEGHVSPVHDNTFPMLLKLIHGSVIDSGIPDNNFDNDNISANSDSSLFPTMSGVAEKAAKESGNRLDRKQMIVYETICSTFLLGLVNEGNDETTLLGRYFSQALQRKETRKSYEPGDDNSCYHPPSMSPTTQLVDGNG